MTSSYLAQSVWRPLDSIDQPVEVVFVGDDPEVADMYRLKLELDGYAVTLATTEQAKSDAASMGAADIVYLDIGLLNPAGLATHRVLRARPGTKHLPIVLLSTRLAREGPIGLKLGVEDLFISSDTVRPDGYWNETFEDTIARH